MNKSTSLLALSILAIMVSGCGKSGDTSQSADALAQQQSAIKNGKEGAELAEPECPAAIDNTLTGPDIVGLKIGMHRDHALNLIRCHNPAAELEFEDKFLQLQNNNPTSKKLGKQLLRATAGIKKTCGNDDWQCQMSRGSVANWSTISERIIVGTPGVPGKETVMAIWRLQTFAEGAMPAVTDTVAALAEKYGKTTDLQSGAGRTPVSVAWLLDPAGAVINKDNDIRLYQSCRNNVNPNGDRSQAWSEGCGLTIVAELARHPNNPNLVSQLLVGLLNQEQLYTYGEAMQQTLNEVDQSRQQKELESAQQTGKKNLQL